MAHFRNKRTSALGQMPGNVSGVRKAKKQKSERKVRGSLSFDMSSSSQSSILPPSPPSTSSSSPLPGTTNVPAINHQQENFELPSPEIGHKDPASNNPKLKDALRNLQIQTDCPIVQNKWHRKFGPPTSWTGPPPQKGSEIFVGRIPKDLFEDELIPILQKAGTLYEVRLMMETTGYNRGFAYVKYSTKSEAERAVNTLNNYEIRNHHFLGVMKSVDNNRLFIGGIPKTRRQEELLLEMKRLTEDVLNVILYADVNDKNKNRGFAFIEYNSHTAAYSARQKLMKTPPLLWGSTLVKVDWAEPEREVDEQTMNKVRILYVRNLALSTSDQQLRELFSRYGGTVERVKKIKDYAFIHFATREQADEAKNKLQGYVVDKCEIDISWSKPVTNREEYQQRKAASKALSSASNIGTPLAQATIGINGEPIIINQKVRTAAGAQGYIASRPYPLRPRQNEESFSPLQLPFVYPNFSYIQDMTARNSIESMGLATALPPTVYAPERLNPVQDFITQSQQDVQYQLAQPQILQRFQPLIPPSPYNMVAASAINNSWGGQPFIPSTGSATQTFISASPYVVPTPSYAPIPGTYAAQPFYGGQMMTQIPTVTGSNMSIDRT